MVNIDLPSRPRLPEWARRSATHFESPTKVKSELRVLNLHTVCESARCPNIHECFHRGAAAFTILGNLCTRGCGFRSVPKGNPRIDRFERAMRLSLRYVVVTSVNRDDLADGGSIHFAETVREIKRALPAARVEVPTPDFNGNREAVARVLDAGPHVFNHNVETVPRLYRRVRPQANYRQSLAALRFARHRQPGVTTKSGFMAGLGETAGEVEQLLRDLRDQDVDVATIGQYLLRNTRKTGRGALDQGAAARFVSSFAVWRRGTAPFALLRNTRKTGRGALDQGAAARFVSSFAVWRRGTAPFALQPTRRNLPVAEYVTQAQFDRYRRLCASRQTIRDFGLAPGFRMAFSGPLVRRSYMADAVHEQVARA